MVLNEFLATVTFYSALLALITFTFMFIDLRIRKKLITAKFFDLASKFKLIENLL